MSIDMHRVPTVSLAPSMRGLAKISDFCLGECGFCNRTLPPASRMLSHLPQRGRQGMTALVRQKSTPPNKEGCIVLLIHR